MNHKEKAKELFDKYYSNIPEAGLQGKYSIFVEHAKQCALIAVDEILNVLWHTHKNEEAWRYYLEVKQEIKKL